MDDSWRERLALYDEPHGDEFFVIDHGAFPPTWYRLDGSVFTIGRNVEPIPQKELLQELARRGWVPGRLYTRLPQAYTPIQPELSPEDL